MNFEYYSKRATKIIIRWFFENTFLNLREGTWNGLNTRKFIKKSAA